MASGEKIRIFVSTEQDRKTIQLFLCFCKLVEKCEIETTTDDAVTLECGVLHLEGLSTICQHLVLLSSTVDEKQVLGEDPEIIAQISEWVNCFLADRTPSGDDLLIRLNDHLEDKVYIAGNCLTFADLIIFAELYPIAETLPGAQYSQFCNFLRWHDYIHGLIKCDELLPPIKRKLPVFDFHPPPKATCKKDKKKEGKGKHKKSDGQQESLNKDNAESSENPPEASKEAKKKAKQEKKKEREAKKLEKQEKKNEELKTSDNEETNLENEDKKRQKAEKKKSKQENKSKKSKREIMVDVLDLRIGQITSIKLHPDADTLYIEEIDVGEDKPRQIITGLVKEVPIEAMENRKVVVCCNLKPATMRGEKSFGMIMCSSDSSNEKVDPLIPPVDSIIGERVTFEGYSNDPIEEIKPKKKILEALFPDLVTDAGNIAKYKDTPFMTTHGPITSSIPNGHIT